MNTNYFAFLSIMTSLIITYLLFVQDIKQITALVQNLMLVQQTLQNHLAYVHLSHFTHQIEYTVI